MSGPRRASLRQDFEFSYRARRCVEKLGLRAADRSEQERKRQAQCAAQPLRLPAMRREHRMAGRRSMGNERADRL